jgi:hypothetical protein
VAEYSAPTSQAVEKILTIQLLLSICLTPLHMPTRKTFAMKKEPLKSTKIFDIEVSSYYASPLNL